MARTRLLAPIVLLAGGAALAACSADAGDFAGNAEQLIDDDKDDQLSRVLDVDFDDAECTEPADTDTGTTFQCTATGDDGNTWQFTATITGSRDYQITDARPVGTGPASTAP